MRLPSFNRSNIFGDFLESSAGGSSEDKSDGSDDASDSHDTDTQIVVRKGPRRSVTLSEEKEGLKTYSQPIKPTIELEIPAKVWRSTIGSNFDNLIVRRVVSFLPHPGRTWTGGSNRDRSSRVAQVLGLLPEWRRYQDRRGLENRTRPSVNHILSERELVNDVATRTPHISRHPRTGSANNAEDRKKAKSGSAGVEVPKRNTT